MELLHPGQGLFMFLPCDVGFLVLCTCRKKHLVLQLGVRFYGQVVGGLAFEVQGCCFKVCALTMLWLSKADGFFRPDCASSPR